MPKRQITNFNFDSRNPGFFYYPSNHVSSNEIFFEARRDTSVDLYLIKYSGAANSFYQPYPFIADGYKNMNAVGKKLKTSTLGERIIFWQTNRSGNWVIAASRYLNGAWTTPEIVISSSEDETNPKLTFTTENDSKYDYDIIFERNNSIFRYCRIGNVAFEDTVFLARNTADYVHYSDPAIIITGYSILKTYIAAVKTTASSFPVLVVKSKSSDTGAWSSESVAFNGAPSRNPNFIRDGFQ
jgi:hypothetical protein